MKYYIVKKNIQLGTIEYKRYKCSDSFCKDKSLSWAFTKQGALKIIEALKNEYRRNIKNLEFYIELAEQ